ncbi:MAG: RNA polymerase sigma factor [Clostridia bacterium]|nr:RNA polymerase sigma factor [Clostridia bacterium]
MKEIDLKEYFLRFKSGDKEAFTEIYDELKKPVFTIAYRITSLRETAEDVTQDLFIKLYISPPDSSVKNPRAWIFSMARNLAIDALRKKQCSDIDEIQIADESAENIDEKIDIEGAIASLSLIEREIISLHLDGGLSFAEIGKAVGLSLPATYRKYKGALNKMRQKLEGGIL